MKPLSEIIESKFTDKELYHGYITGLYEKLLAPYREKTITMLEIGIAVGGSIRMWNEYFTNATIHGVDILYDTAACGSLDPAIVHKRNAYDEKFAASLPAFDLIIDDGPHDLLSMHFCLVHYLPKLKAGGLLIIEDVPTHAFVRSLSAHTQPDLVVDCRLTSSTPNLADDSRIMVWKAR